jgi:hypothetical protein
MNELLEKAFEEMGARIKLREQSLHNGGVRLDIRNDKKGEFFDVIANEDTELVVLDVQPDDRHLLLMTRTGPKRTKARFLAGHDERHWFVASIPEKTPVSTVKDAKKALKPDKVKEKPVDKTRRQGEWFFIPRPDAIIDEKLILHNEPLTRGRGSKPHRCQELYRMGGTGVYVSRKYPNGLAENEYDKLDSDVRKNAGPWRHMVRNPQVFVRGHIKHSDHKTLNLSGWHEVLMNSENQSLAMKNVAFLD